MWRNNEPGAADWSHAAKIVCELTMLCICPLQCSHGGFGNWENTSQSLKPFSQTAPHLWNVLPLNTRLAPSLSTFKTHLKTNLFNEAYG
ncbi:hypothetical protein FKM82_024892 [Ascaphus truei]